MRLTWAIIGLVASALVLVQPATADPAKTSCPIGTDWQLATVDEAAGAIWPFLVDQSPWESEEEFADSAIAPYDKNGDGAVCLKTNAQSNPNGNWYEFPLFITRDNNSNAG